MFPAFARVLSARCRFGVSVARTLLRWGEDRGRGSIRQFGWDERDWGWGERLRMDAAANVGVPVGGGLAHRALARARLSSAMCAVRRAAVIRPKWAMSYKLSRRPSGCSLQCI